jgi:hypothetical protein
MQIEGANRESICTVYWILKAEMNEHLNRNQLKAMFWILLFYYFIILNILGAIKTLADVPIPQ